MSSDKLRASPAIRRKVDISSANEEAIAGLERNIKKSKTDQDESGTASETSQDKNISDVPPQLSINVPKISDLKVSSTDWNDVQLPVDILLITVKHCEFLASYSYLENPFKSYCLELGYVHFGKMGQLKVALLRCQEGSSTPGGATIAAKNAITKMKPKAVFSVGVCSALSHTKANLGDVVIPSKLATYAHKIVTNEGVQPCGIRIPISRDLSYVIRHAADGWKAPLQDPDAREVKVDCDSVILSGPEIVNAKQRCEELIQLHPDATAIETEGEGFFAAAVDLNMELVIVKAIADYADGTATSESWRTVAGVMAASVVANILSNATVFQTRPHYQDKDNL